jgi:ArsR family transcriptional regulator
MTADCRRPRAGNRDRVIPLTPTAELRNARTSRRMRATAEPARLQIVAILASAPRGLSVNQLVKELGYLTQPTVSIHLRELDSVGLITCRRRGSYHVYSIDRAAFRSLASRVRSLGGAK